MSSDATEADAALTRECRRHLESLPPHLVEFAASLGKQVADFGDAHAIDARDMAAALSGLVASLAVVAVQGDVSAEDELREFMTYVRRLMHVALAKSRLAEGWRPPAAR